MKFEDIVHNKIFIVLFILYYIPPLIYLLGLLVYDRLCNHRANYMVNFKKIKFYYYLGLITSPWLVLVFTIKYQLKQKVLHSTSKRSDWVVEDLGVPKSTDSPKLGQKQGSSKISPQGKNTLSRNFDRKPTGEFDMENNADQFSRPSINTDINQQNTKEILMRQAYSINSNSRKVSQENRTEFVGYTPVSSTSVHKKNINPDFDSHRPQSVSTIADNMYSNYEKDFSPNNYRSSKQNLAAINFQDSHKELQNPVNTIGINVNIQQPDIKVNYKRTSIYANYLNYNIDQKVADFNAKNPITKTRTKEDKKDLKTFDKVKSKKNRDKNNKPTLQTFDEIGSIKDSDIGQTPDIESQGKKFTFNNIDKFQSDLSIAPKADSQILKIDEINKARLPHKNNFLLPNSEIKLKKTLSNDIQRQDTKENDNIDTSDSN